MCESVKRKYNCEKVTRCYVTGENKIVMLGKL